MSALPSPVRQAALPGSRRGGHTLATRLRLQLHEISEIVGGLVLMPARPEVITGFIEAAASRKERGWTICSESHAGGVVGVVRSDQGAGRRDRGTQKSVMMSLGFLFAGRCSSQQYDDTSPRSVRRRANLTVRCAVSSN